MWNVDQIPTIWFRIWTKPQKRHLGITLEKSYARMTSQCRHMSEIVGNPTVCSTVEPKNKETIKSPRYEGESTGVQLITHIKAQ